jgi:Mce-associated membrane protein
MRRLLLVFTLATALCACWSGWSWYAAAHDGEAAFSRLREHVLGEGARAVQNLNTLDYRDLERGLDLWEGSTTGELHRQITGDRAAFERQVVKAKTVTGAQVLDGAVAELDERAGRARLLFAVRMTLAPPGAEPVDKRMRLIAELARTSGGWKVSALSRAPGSAA